MFLMSAALLAALQIVVKPQPVILSINARCEVRADGELVPVGELRISADQWVRDGRDVEPHFDRAASASCANDLMTTLTEADVTFRLYRDAGAARPVYLSTLPGRCVVTINGRAITFARYDQLAKRWTSTQPQIHLQPLPDAAYVCVDRILKVLSAHGVVKLGFVGNETSEPEKPQ